MEFSSTTQPAPHQTPSAKLPVIVLLLISTGTRKLTPRPPIGAPGRVSEMVLPMMFVRPGPIGGGTGAGGPGGAPSEIPCDELAMITFSWIVLTIPVMPPPVLLPIRLWTITFEPPTIPAPALPVITLFSILQFCAVTPVPALAPI